jgi:glycosyltransferase involved in cell wall biosynthesis
MISVIIPTFNRAHLIDRAVRSILAQQFTEWQLVVVDDGSKDNTAEVMRAFLNDSRIKYIKKENTGAAHTRNVGVEGASNEWITFLDSDDEATPDWLAKFAEKLLAGAEIVTCGLQKYDEKGVLTSTTIPKQNKRNIGGQFTNGGVYLLRKSVFNTIGQFDPKLRSGQHTELYFRIKKYALENGIKTSIIPEPLIKVHIHSGYRIRSDHNAKFEGSLYTYKKHYDDALKSKKLRSLFEGIIAYNAHKLNRYGTAVQYGWKSLMNRPSKKGIQRLFRYLLRLK